MGNVDTGLLLDQRYRLVARRAAGATATVWETDDEFLRRRVAVKLLHDHLAVDDDFRARFVEEARTAATVNHPNLVAVYDSISDQPGIVLEWVDGPDLRQRLDEGPLTPSEVVTIGAAISDGLAALHAHGLVHRDVKPANILLTSQGEPKLTDFGIATTNAGDRTATGVVLGTAKYLAPEQVRGTPLDGRADLFALAAVLYEALSGSPPWVRDGDLPTALARLEEYPNDLRTTRPDLPPELCDIVMRGLERDPVNRWPTIADFATALRSASTLSGSALSGSALTRSTLAPPPTRRLPDPEPRTTALAAPPARPVPPVRPRRRRWPRLVGFAIVVLIAALGWTLVASIGGADTPGPITGADVLTIQSVEAFDPEGTGAPGEHNERAAAAIDLDTSTAWPTERYRSRDLGSKSGVGLVLTLDRVTDVEMVTVRTTGANDWAAEIRVATGLSAGEASSIAEFGDAVGRGDGLGAIAELAVSGRGDTVVVWITDLGDGDAPVSLAISEITIR